jgi:hypothetical protein
LTIADKKLDHSQRIPRHFAASTKRTVRTDSTDSSVSAAVCSELVLQADEEVDVARLQQPFVCETTRGGLSRFVSCARATRKSGGVTPFFHAQRSFCSSL